MDFNLLPREITPSKSQKKVTSAANKIAMFFLGVFILAVLLGGGLYLLFNSRLEAVKKEAGELTVNIQSLQSTEQSLILLKDRVQKISAILNSRTNENYYTKHNEVLAVAPETVTFEESEIEAGRSILGVKILDSLSLVGLFSGLRASSSFSSLVVSELTYSPITGFLVSLDVF